VSLPMPLLWSPPISAWSRTLIATITGVAFILAYIVLVVTLPDLVPRQHWAVQALYWCIAGVLWVLPAWALMLFAAGPRRDAGELRR